MDTENCSANVLDRSTSDVFFPSGRRRFALKKVQPWNSVKVTLDIPKEAADRLRLLALQGNVRLMDLGILSVEIVGQSNAILLNPPTTKSNTTTTTSLKKDLSLKRTTSDELFDESHRTKRIKFEEKEEFSSTRLNDQFGDSAWSNCKMKVNGVGRTLIFNENPPPSSSAASSSSNVPSSENQ